MAGYKIVSADDHMDMSVIPPKLWEERLPAKWRDRAPRVVDTPDGGFWHVDGESFSYSGKPKNRAVASAISRAGIDDNGFRPSTPELRLQDMDLDGIYSQVIYGPPMGFRIGDAALKAECLKVYNSWAAEFSATSPDRLTVLAYLPMHDPAAATDELRRVAGIGHKGAVVSMFETNTPIYEPDWDPLWAAAQEVGLPLSFHLGGGCHTVAPVPQSWKIEAFAAVAPMQLDEALVVMVFCGALDRHPGMKLVLGESGLGWIPYVIERMELEARNHGPSVKDVTLRATPREIFDRQIFATFEEDRLGVELIPHIGADNVMWASDYPHPDSTFPRSLEAIEDVFKDVDADTVRKVTCDNAAKLYHVQHVAA